MALEEPAGQIYTRSATELMQSDHNTECGAAGRNPWTNFKRRLSTRGEGNDRDRQEQTQASPTASFYFRRGPWCIMLNLYQRARSAQFRQGTIHPTEPSPPL